MNYEQHQSPLWWTRNIRVCVYFVRELTGVVIALYALYFVFAGAFDPTLAFMQTAVFRTVSMAALGASIIHAITWLWVTVKITPFSLTKPLQIVLFFGLIGAWIGASYFLLRIFYTQ